MRLTRVLLWLAGIALAVTGGAYVVVPGAALGIVGIGASPTTEFLLRTQGVALIAAAVFLLLIPPARTWRTRVALVALAGYLFVGSVVDVRAHLDGIVGPASLPSAGIRVAAAALCVLAAIARRQTAATAPAAAAGSSAELTDAAAADG